jgi:ADP-ribosylglycohydrolase
MLVEIAIGDAYGRPFEFASREFIDSNNEMQKYVNREGESFEYGIYTDDTQMSLALCECLISKGRKGSTHLDYYRKFKNAYVRDPRGGYSRRTRTSLESNSYREFLTTCHSSGKTSNGSVMRTVPLGVLADIDVLKSEAIMHSSLTHCSHEAIDATILVSLVSHAYFYGLYREGLYDWLKEIGEGELYVRVMKHLPTETLPCDALQTAALSISIVENMRSMRDMLSYAVGFSGDVDSVASISLGLASMRDEEKKRWEEKTSNDLPKFLYENLENDRFGISHLRKIDKKILETVY